MTEKEQRRCFSKGEKKLPFAKPSTTLWATGDRQTGCLFDWYPAVKNYFRSLTSNFFCYSSQLQPACQRGLMALCSLGLVSGDATLAGAALGELMKQKDGKMK